MENEIKDQQLEPANDEVIQQETEPHGTEAETAPETDWKAMARKWEKQAKENKDAADELAALKAAKNADLEAANKRAAEAEAKVAQLEANAAREKTVNAVAAETGVSAAVLNLMRGDTEEEIRANAQVMRSNIPIFPSVKETGNAAAPQITKESILAIENEQARIKAIQENMSLFQ